MKKITNKGFLTWFDKDGNSCVIMEMKDCIITQPLQEIDIKKINTLKPTKPIKISVIPKAKDGTGNIIYCEISRKEKNMGGIECPKWKYVETKQNYKKREKKLISKIIKR